MLTISRAFIIANLALFAAGAVLPRMPAGTQFITGACRADADCASDCCAFTTGKCAGAVIAQTRDGGCGFGEATPNNRAAQVIQGANASAAPGVPKGGAAPAPAAGNRTGGGSVTVKPGDTCGTLAAAAGTNTAALIAANPGVNAGCTNLQVGQVLNTSGGAAAPAPAAPAPAAPAAGGPGKPSGKPPGTQFITGDCATDSECASGCCGVNTVKCAARLVALESGGGCRGNGGAAAPAAPAPAAPPAAAPAAGGGPGKPSGKPPGTQFITGDCAADADCASGCCGVNTVKCAARLVALESGGGCRG